MASHRGTGWYRAIDAVIAPSYPIVTTLAPRYATTTEAMGRAMINVALKGWPIPVLESSGINAAATQF
jgi:hypothetical protein